MANCLYNGVDLPALPGRDEEKYPYVAICYRNTNDEYHYSVVFSTQPLKYRAMTLRHWLYAEDASSGYEHYCNAGMTEWVNAEAYEKEASDSIAMAEPLIWANHNIYYHADTIEGTPGELYLAASDPIPVDPIDPSAMLMGWLVGKRIAGQRK